MLLLLLLIDLLLLFLLSIRNYELVRQFSDVLILNYDESIHAAAAADRRC